MALSPLWRAMRDFFSGRPRKGIDKCPKTCIIVFVRQNIAGLCKGSTADSDSVCEGSNPSPAARRDTALPCLFFVSLDTGTSVLIDKTARPPLSTAGIPPPTPKRSGDAQRLRSFFRYALLPQRSLRFRPTTHAPPMADSRLMAAYMATPASPVRLDSTFPVSSLVPPEALPLWLCRVIFA